MQSANPPEIAETEQALLQRAEAAYARGDYRALRRELAGLQATPQQPDIVKARLAELELASAEDPAFAVVVALLAAGLFVVCAHYILG
jgi:hypothetical protein